MLIGSIVVDIIAEVRMNFVMGIEFLNARRDLTTSIFDRCSDLVLISREPDLNNVN